MEKTDVAIVGGGIVGLATAWQITQRRPELKVVVLEKEPELAAHQTGHNSGVLHAGVYYKPGSLKAINCRQGRELMFRFCEEEGIKYELCGKVVVAVTKEELPSMEMIYERAKANGVDCEKITIERLKELEPHAAGVAAFHVRDTGIIDFKEVCYRLAKKMEERGGKVLTRAKVTGIRRSSSELVLITKAGDFSAKLMINCAGLHSDRIARMAGEHPQVKIVPFRGEYYDIKPEHWHLVNNLIYPVPNPEFPFLGVHFTRKIHGGVDCGPNAVFAFAREGYTKLKINVGDLCESVFYPGLWKIAGKYMKIGIGEMWRSFVKSAFVKALQRLVPDITGDMLVPAPAGVRAQAIARDGKMVDDFVIQESERVINVLNAPSPAATASLNIGKTIAELVDKHISK
ncbi:MAG: L-2-hydroxyglutarate oxidase [candidate division WOR-3 bacterium]